VSGRKMGLYVEQKPLSTMKYQAYSWRSREQVEILAHRSW
jgi:hypothetical protein